MRDLESILARCKKVVDEHSAIHVMEFIDQSKVKKISIKALTNAAEKDARAVNAHEVMLLALKTLQASLKHEGIINAMVDSAIAKAEGRS